MKGRQKTVTILMADDDEDDSLLVSEALAETRLPINLHIVRNGDELMDYLYCRGEYADGYSAPCPDLILLDLNMPKKGGLEVLKEIKTDPMILRIPVIVLTTSRETEDIYQTYNLGANSCIPKPVTFAGLVEVMTTIVKYWFEIVQLPRETEGGRNGPKSNESIAS